VEIVDPVSDVKLLVIIGLFSIYALSVDY